MKSKHLMLSLGMLLVAFSASAQKQLEMNLWQSGAPNSNGDSTDTAKVYVYLHGSNCHVKYEGEFNGKNQYDGKGTMYDESGDVSYKGYWKDGDYNVA